MRVSMRALVMVTIVGILFTPVASAQRVTGTGISEQALKGLNYGDVVARYPCYYERIRRGDGTGGSRVYDRIEKRWGPPKPKEGRRPLHIDSVVSIYPSSADAQEAFEEHVRGSSGLVHETTPNGTRLGDRFRAVTSGEVVFFAAGRVTVSVTVLSQDPIEVNAALTEALARGLEYNLYMQPQLTQVAPAPRLLLRAQGRPVPADESPLVLRGVAFVPLSVFEAQGAKVKPNPAQGNITVSYKGLNVTLKEFEREVLAGAETIDLGAPPFWHKERLIVPLRAVADALGMKVETTASGQIVLR